MTLKITLQNPPTGVWFAVQVGKAASSRIEQIQVSNGEGLNFEMDVTIKGNAQVSPLPDFGGAYVQGKVGERFVYICIGTSAGQMGSPWTRRLKIPLSNISWEMAQQRALHTFVKATAKDGSPTCGTVKPFGGWQAMV